LRTSATSTVLCIVLGVPLALVLARASFPGQRLLRAFVLLPLVLPPVVGGIALLYTFGRQGLLGRSLELAGIQIAFSTTAVVLAQTFVALPFLVVSLEGALRTAGTRYEAVAATLGARPTTVLRRVSIPLVLPGLASGAVLSFARCLGEFGATLTFAGSLQGVTRTLPLEIYLQRETDADSAVALSLVLVAVAVAVVGLSYRRPRALAGRGRTIMTFTLNAALHARSFDVGLHARARGNRRRAGPQWSRQVDTAGDHRRAPPPGQRARSARTENAVQARRREQPLPAAARPGNSAARTGAAAVSAHERAGERRLWTAGGRREPGQCAADGAPLAGRSGGRGVR
jgi:molybdate transport system permease protein